MLLLVFGLRGFAVNFIQSKNSRLSSTLHTMTKPSQNPVDDVLRNFFQPFLADMQRELNRARDDLLYRFITENDCTSSPAHWSLDQLGKFYRVMVPIISNCYFNDNAGKKFPELKKLLETHREIKADDRVQHMHNQLGQCSSLRAEVEAFLQPYIHAQSKRRRKRISRDKTM